MNLDNWTEPFKIAFKLGMFSLGWLLVLLIGSFVLALSVALLKSVPALFKGKKKSKKTVHFADNFLIEGVKGEAARLDDATSRLASSSGPAPAAAAPAPAEEISAKGFANKGVYDQEDGPPISSIDVKSGTMFEMYYLGWLDKNVPLAPVAAA
jgi:hypothetical protein